MRCQACNDELNDFESTWKDENGSFYDLCSRCWSISKEAELNAAIANDVGKCYNVVFKDTKATSEEPTQ